MRGEADLVSFARSCGIEPYSWQADLLRLNPQSIVVERGRATGKSTTAAIVALHHAVSEAGATAFVVSPSHLQSAAMLRTIKGLHERLDRAPAIEVQSVVKLKFANGSCIVAQSHMGRGMNVSLAVYDEAQPVAPLSAGKMIAFKSVEAA